MYKGRSCVERKNKSNSAWTKTELMDECKKFGITCSSKLDKKKICNLLNNHQVVPLNICNLPKNALYNALMNLDWNDIVNLCKTNKKCNEICKDDLFWQKKVLLDFPDISDKPKHISYKNWYIKLTKSGDLYQLGIDKLDTGFIDENVYKCFQFDDELSYYINIWDELWQFDPSETTEYLKTTKIMDNVKDVYVGNQILYLLVNGELIDENEKLIHKNIKSIEYNPSIKHKCLAIGLNKELYLLDVFNDSVNIKSIDKNVETAKIVHKNISYIYYVTYDGMLHVKFGYTTILSLGSDPEYQQRDYIHIIMVYENVKDIALSHHYIVILDRNNKSWLYGIDYSCFPSYISHYNFNLINEIQISGSDNSIYNFIWIDEDRDLAGMDVGHVSTILDNNVLYINNGQRILYIKNG